ncbi:DUF1413 domain-containing protein [Shewanella frigidimarina]|uniref:DUF1413 domain-containing protein n=1 Tax=Shewanella frigidimarina TaxID=56812 RepID=UPI003D794B85
MTVRLDENVLNKLNTIASDSGITRQDLVEEILIKASGHIEDDLSNKTISYVSNKVLESIKIESEKLDIGTEVSLKRLVGEEQWSELTDATRRVFGKQFRDMVNDGLFSCLKTGRKKSNNEQQYDVYNRDRA